MKNELLAMKTFTTVVDTQNFSSAARLLGVGQSSVSRRVADLETHLGTALLVRTTRSVRPTEVGLRYYESARSALAAVDAARATAMIEPRGLTGTLRVGCGVTFGNSWLAPRLCAWLVAHPDLRLEMVPSDTHVDLVSAGLDISLRFGGPSTSELVGRRLRVFTRSMMASPAWVDHHGLPSTPQDLRDHRGLLFGDAATREWELQRGSERITVRPDRVVVASTGSFLETLARQGLGPVLMPQWIGDPAEASGALVRLLPDWYGEPLTLWAVRPKHRYASAATRLFLEWMVEQAHPS